jgi:hypothetical protein
MDRNPLLPPDAPPPLEDDGDGQQERSEDDRPTWASVKRAMTKLARSGSQGGASRPALAKLGSRFVGAKGGSRAAATAAAAGRRSALSLGGFLAQATQQGLDTALSARGLAAATGQPIEFLLDQLLNALAPVGETLEEQIARLAMSKTLDELFETALESGDIAALGQLSEADAVRALEIYLTHYINTTLMQALSDRNEANSPAAAQAAAVEDDIKAYVKDTVRLDMNALDRSPNEILQMDWSGHDGKVFIDRIFVDAFKLMEEGA